VSQHHHLYNLAAWKRARAHQLRLVPVCRMCKELGLVALASVVDHVTPHRGDLDKFLDSDNLQSLCKPCHDRHKQAQEHQRDGLVRGAGHEGQPIDLAHPWHSAGRVGGGEKSAGQGHKTGPHSLFAACHNSEGGASA
jgi:5-methylcytosine-specific restriction protein A